MAVSKSARRFSADTSQSIQDIFRASVVSDEQRFKWHQAVRHAETANPRYDSPSTNICICSISTHSA